MNIINAGYSDICITHNFNNLFDFLNINNQKVLFVIDKNVATLYKNDVLQLTTKNNIFVHEIVAVETNKSLEQVEEIYDVLVNDNFNRKDLIVAVGGGIITDITGFVASTFMRGINYSIVPTTLLCMCDSCYGGKTGIAFKNYKNMIGTFYHAQKIYINLEVLNTLPINEIKDGLVEAFKCAIIYDNDFYGYILQNIDLIINKNTQCLEYIVENSLKIKSQVCEQDEKDFGIRRILNYGHTFGHSIETATDFNISHGSAVGLGIICSSYISLTRNLINSDTYEEIYNIVTKFVNNNLCDYDIDANTLYNNMLFDKKVDDGINIIIVDKIGSTNIVKTNKEECIKALKVLTQEN